MRCSSEVASRSIVVVAAAGVAMLLLGSCSAGDGAPSSMPPLQGGAGSGPIPGDAPGLEGANAQPATGGNTGSGAASTGVDNYDRPLGMPIGQGASGNDEAPGENVDTALDPGQTPADDELEIPVFEAADDGPPCSGCVELQVLVNDINQRDDFVLDAGGMAGVTRVVWTIVVPFNSDQLFVQPFVDDAFGTYTDLDANAFAIDTPVQLEQTLPGAVNAGSIGLAIGSSGAWTGDMVMSLFVDSVTIQANGASASRSFDASAEGLATRTNAHQPRVVYHP